MVQSNFHKFASRIRSLLLTGTAPDKLALSIVIGLVIGVFPILGTTTLLCAAVAWMLRLNLPAIQLVNYLSAPLQLICLFPFIRLGEAMLGTPALKISAAQIASLNVSDVPEAFTRLWTTGLHAAAGWLLVAPALGALALHPLAAALRRIDKAIAARRLVPDVAQKCL
jgi:uncharacterized protein (DUF2062 family)